MELVFLVAAAVHGSVCVEAGALVAVEAGALTADGMGLASCKLDVTNNDMHIKPSGQRQFLPAVG